MGTAINTNQKSCAGARCPDSRRIRRAETGFRLLADMIPEIAWAARPDGCVDYYNQKWYERTAAARGKSGDESWLPVLHPEDRQKCLDTWYESIRTGRPFQLELRFRFPSTREYRWHLGRALPLLDENGQVVRWFGTSTDIHAVRAASQQEIKELTRRLVNAHEQERQRVGRELHDDIAQRLALLSVGLRKLKQDSPARLKSRFSRILREVDEMSSGVRELSHQLHPAVLQYSGLKGALNSLCRQTCARHDVRVDLDMGDGIASLSNEVSLCLFRVAQEALNNSVKHGRASRVMIQLRSGKDSLRMQIRDTGTGFDPEAIIRGLGILSMRERLRLLNGELIVRSRLGEGTEVIAELPLEETSATARLAAAS